MSNRRIILSGGIAKRLLNRGHIIADVKPQRENPKESVFIFFADKFLNEDITSVMNSKGNDKAEILKRIESLGVSIEAYRAAIWNEYMQSGIEQCL